MGVHESRIRQALIELDIDQAAFAVLSGLSQSRLSMAFRGTKDFSGPEIEKLSALVTDLCEITESANPIPVSFRNLDAVRRLLEHKRGGIVWAAAVHEEEVVDQSSNQ
jgi:transcriptional regulator with XRE-family HTH domain